MPEDDKIGFLVFDELKIHKAVKFTENKVIMVSWVQKLLSESFKCLNNLGQSHCIKKFNVDKRKLMCIVETMGISHSS